MAESYLLLRRPKVFEIDAPHIYRRSAITRQKSSEIEQDQDIHYARDSYVIEDAREVLLLKSDSNMRRFFLFFI